MFPRVKGKKKKQVYNHKKKTKNPEISVWILLKRLKMGTFLVYVV